MRNSGVAWGVDWSACFLMPLNDHPLLFYFIHFAGTLLVADELLRQEAPGQNRSVVIAGLIRICDARL